VRLTVASCLLAAAVALVVPTVLVGGGTSVSVAAVVALLAGLVASRIVYAEVVQTRAHASRDRVEQARAFEAAITRNLSEHAEFTTLMSGRLRERDGTIRELQGTLRLAERRADDAESRVKREARRANEAQHRLSVLLDEVAAHQAALQAAVHTDGDTTEAASTEELSELPTIVDLLAWEERLTAQPPSQELPQEA
jgi:TolA-binding protein